MQLPTTASAVFAFFGVPFPENCTDKTLRRFVSYWMLDSTTRDAISFSAKPVKPDEYPICGLLFVPNEVPKTGMHCITTEDPKRDFFKLMRAVYPEGTSHSEWMPLARIGRNSVVENTMAGENVTVGHNSTIGGVGFGFTEDDGIQVRNPHVGFVMLGDNVEIGSNTCIDRGCLDDTILHRGVKVDNLVHIAHGAKIGKGTLIVAGAVIGGSAEIGENCFIGINASIRNKVKLGDNVTVGMGAVVTKSFGDGVTLVGNPAREM